MTCGFGDTGEGWDGDHHCYQCWRLVRDMCRQFARDVRAGKFDAQGYTPNERKAQAKKRAA